MPDFSGVPRAAPIAHLKRCLTHQALFHVNGKRRGPNIEPKLDRRSFAMILAIRSDRPDEILIHFVVERAGESPLT
jgi:hypothetical protein